MTKKYIDKILAARVYDVAIESSLDHASILSRRLNNHVLMKREDQQPVFSFKLRGAYNKIVNLTEAEKKNGIIAASAGNHAQGVALAGMKLAIKSIIVMPETTPGIKVDAVRCYGAKTILHGDTFDEAYLHALDLTEKHGLTFIHPFDDPDIIAGQGTIAMEIIKQYTDPVKAIFVPVGGGGLIAGIACYYKHLRPDTLVIGVEPEDAPTLYMALQKGRRITLDQVGLFADGVAVRQIGKETFRVAKKHVDEVLLVTTDEICAAIKDVFDDTRALLEPAGALAVAGLKKYVRREKITDSTLIVINSGANINFDRLRHVAERAEIGECREAVFSVTIPEKPGSFRKFCRAIGKRSITEFNYRYSDASQAQVYVGVEVVKRDAKQNSLLEELTAKGYSVIDLTDNELAKVHMRHMVGGRSTSVKKEVVYRFEFPERPGALLKFLNTIGENWNISLFHYRNHGAAYGRVLVGMQVPDEDIESVQTYFDKLGYRYWEETENPAYQLFCV